MSKKNTAVLIFANSAHVDGEVKPFKSSTSVFEHLNDDVIHKVKMSGLPYVLISERQQTGHSFGERFTNAIQHVYDLGFDNIITVGNDSPHLRTKQLNETARLLEHKDMVLGPSKDGGFYLMGLRKSHFNKKVFLKLPWQTAQLVTSIKAIISKSRTNLHTLETLLDIDTLKDLKTIFNSFKSLSLDLKRLLVLIFHEIQEFNAFIEVSFYSYTLDKPFNKGSPSFLIA